MITFAKVSLMGYVGATPEIRTFGNDKKFATFRIATTEVWTDRERNEKRENTSWHSVSVFGPLVGVIEQAVRKGTPLYIEGKLVTRKVTKNQEDRYYTEVQVNGDGMISVLETKAQAEARTTAAIKEAA